MAFSQRRVLVVEDEFLAALTTVDLLESIGCEVVGPASRLAEALGLALSEPLDAAVLDINIAGELIWPVARALQRRSVPCVFLSAYSKMDLIPAPFDTCLCLSKPLEQRRLAGHLGGLWDTSTNGSAAR